MKSPLALISFVAAATLLSCGGDESKFLSVKSNDIELEPQGVLAFPRRVDRRGHSDPRVVKIKNSGEEQLLKVSNFYLEGDLQPCDFVTANIGPYDPVPEPLASTCMFAITERPSLPLSIAATESIDLKIIYRQLDGIEPVPAYLVVESDVREVKKNPVRLEITVEGGAPEINVDRDVVTFVDGVAGEGVVVVLNNGSAPLEVQAPTLNVLTPQPMGPTGEIEAEFTIDADDDFPWSIEENEGKNLYVRYAPKDDVRDTAELIFHSNDPTRSALSVRLTSAPVTAALHIMPSPVVFTLDRGQLAKTIPLVLQNAGLRTINIFDVRALPSTDYTPEGQTQISIRAGETTDVLSVVYRPRTAEGSDAELLISTDADNATNQLITVPLVRSAMTLPGRLAVDNLAFALNGVPLGGTGQATVRLSNVGGAALSITKIVFSTADDVDLAPESDPEFTFTSGARPVTLEPGASHSVTVSFARGAEDRNDHFAAMIIHSEGAARPEVVYFTSAAPDVQ